MSDRTVSRGQLWLDALRGFYRGQLPLSRLDPVSRWLYAGRFLILVISAQAAAIAALIALPSGRMTGWLFAPLLLGLVIAHAISNFSNDYFGFARGHDTDDSPRVTYTIHPLAHKVLTRRALATGIALLWTVAALIGAVFVVERGYSAAILFIAGALMIYLYDAAPKSLKAIGLGELASLIVWGPLMVGGGYYCLTGDFSWNAVLVSVPYGMGIAGILLGKHIDQEEFDREHGLKTLPVLLGVKASRHLNQGMVISIYALTAVLVALGRLTPFSLLILLNLPSGWRLLKACAAPRPERPPDGYVGWPLWFHRFNLLHNRRLGWLYILGIALGDAWTMLHAATLFS